VATDSTLPSVRRRRFEEAAARHRPRTPVLARALKAFVAGGAVSLVGQAVMQFFLAHGYSAQKAPAPTAVVLIGLGALFTGLGWYDRVVKWGGMGGSLPITGFANAIVAPAMEYKREGAVLGVGAKMFTVAGPVLAYGMAAAFVVGLARMAWDLWFR
jgi:stage V sporulation protein AC